MNNPAQIFLSFATGQRHSCPDSGFYKYVFSLTFFCVQGVCVISDPIISGFDGRTFHFDEIGEYVMLESGDGYKASWMAIRTCCLAGSKCILTSPSHLECLMFSRPCKPPLCPVGSAFSYMKFLQVHTTFAGASATNSELEVMEKSW